MSDLYFNKESDYSEQNTSGNEGFHSTILQPFGPERDGRMIIGVVRGRAVSFWYGGWALGYHL